MTANDMTETGLIPNIDKQLIQSKGLPRWFSGKESAYSAGDAEGTASIPRPERSHGGRNGNPLKYSWAFLMVQLVKNPPAMRET